MLSREVQRFRVEEFVRDPDQPRKAFGEEALRTLGQTLATKQLHPVLAYRKNGKLVILDGERRWRAAQLVGLAELDAIVVEEPSEKGSLVWQQTVAGLHQEGLLPCEKARAMSRWMAETGGTAAAAAEQFGISPGSATKLLALLGLPTDVQEQVDAGKVPASTAYEIARVEGAEEQRRLAEAAASGRLKRGDLSSGKRVPTERVRDGAPEATARVTAVLGGERQVSVVAPGLSTLEQVIECLEELLAKARRFRSRGVDLATFVAQLKLDAKSAGREGRHAESEAGPC